MIMMRKTMSCFFGFEKALLSDFCFDECLIIGFVDEKKTLEVFAMISGLI